MIFSLLIVLLVQADSSKFLLEEKEVSPALARLNECIDFVLEGKYPKQFDCVSSVKQKELGRDYFKNRRVLYRGDKSKHDIGNVNIMSKTKIEVGVGFWNKGDEEGEEYIYYLIKEEKEWRIEKILEHIL
jgi:hypothetical protein